MHTEEGLWLEGLDGRTERERMESALEVAAALAEHRFNKGLGRCACGLQMEPRGHREAQWRSHMAEVLTGVTS